MIIVIEYIGILNVKTERLWAILSRTIYLQSSFPSPIKVQADGCKYHNDDEKDGNYDRSWGTSNSTGINRSFSDLTISTIVVVFTMTCIFIDTNTSILTSTDQRLGLRRFVNWKIKAMFIVFWSYNIANFINSRTQNQFLMFSYLYYIVVYLFLLVDKDICDYWNFPW